LLLVIAVSIVSCKSDDDGVVAFTLSNTNIAGTHALNFFLVNLDQSLEFNGIPVTSNTSIVGDTFQVTAVFGDNGTYTISGQYRIVATVTVGGISETDTEIIVLDDSGTYQINTTDQTITMSGLNELGDGVFDVELFNETEFRLTQTISETTPDITSTTTTELRFVRE
jgi:hypothetical protein